MADNPLVSKFHDFPVPRLDDRTTADLMAELRSLIPIYCPDWTNHNPSDPGITVLELFSWLTEVMLYRLNRVPVRNLFSLLDLMGVQPAPPSPARTPIVVTPNGGAHGGVLPAGTEIASRRRGDAEPLYFETERDLILTAGRLTRVIASSGEATLDVTPTLGQVPFSPFAGATAVDRFLYLGDDRIGGLREEGIRVHLVFSGPSAHRDLYARWRWELFDGETWAPAKLAVGHGHGEVILASAPWMVDATVDGQKGAWIRAAHLPGEEPAEEIAFTDIEVEVESVDLGVMPEATFLNPGGDVIFNTLDVTRVFHPLGADPRKESTLYVLNKELMRSPGTRLELCFTAPDEEVYPRPEVSPDLTIRVEYPIPGSRWSHIGDLTSNVVGTAESTRLNLRDTTRALRREGIVAFDVPEDIEHREIQGISGPWIRLRLTRGTYSAKVEEDEEALHAQRLPAEPVGPAFESLLLRARSPSTPIKTAVAYSDFTYTNLWPEGEPRSAPITLFPHREAYARALYLALTKAFPAGQASLFIKMLGGAQATTETGETGRRIKWEVATPSGFLPLTAVDDQTRHFSRDGYVRFEAPEHPEAVELFSQKAHWIRARLAEGDFDAPPKVEDLKTNAVPALGVQTHIENRTLPSDGMPDQEIQLQRSPILGAVSLWVREAEPPRTEAEREAIYKELGEGAISEIAGEVWTRWKQIDHFFSAGPDSRVFRLDPHDGVVRFGNGVNGKVPSPAGRAIRIESYWIGGGARGNVGPHTLTVLTESNALVASIDNPFPADGGADAEGLHEAAQRGTRRMYTIDRAWSAGDYAALAREASRRVAKVVCLEPKGTGRQLARRRGETVRPSDQGPVEVIIIPERAHPSETGRAVPSVELLQRVEDYLEARRCLNARIAVRGPVYRPFTVSCAVYLRSHDDTQAEDEIKAALRLYLDPLVGGDDGRGWPLGTTVRRAGLFQVVAAAPSVMSLRELRMIDMEGNDLGGAFPMGRDELPSLAQVKVVTEVLR